MILNLTNISVSESPDTLSEKLYSIGIFCIVLLIISLISNTTLIWILLKNKTELLCYSNILVLFLAIISLIGAIIELSIIITTTFKQK